jgi:hypothetical protein
MLDLVKLVLAQHGVDLATGEQGHKGLPEPGRNRAHRRGHPYGVVIENAVGLVVGEHHPGPGRSAGDGGQRLVDRIRRQVHRDAEPGEHRPLLEGAARLLQRRPESLALEVDRHEDQVGGDRHPEIGESALFPGLRGRMVDLEHAEAGVGVPVREGVKPRPQDHVLANTRTGLLLHDVLRVPGPHANPPTERQQVVVAELGSQPVPEREPLLARELQGKSVVEDQRWWFLSVEIASDRGQQSRAARSRIEGRHAADCNNLCWLRAYRPAVVSIRVVTKL